MKKFLLVFLLSLYFSSIFAANNNNEQNIQTAKNIWSSVSNAWDAAIRANSNTNLLTQSLNTISSKLVLSTLWSGTFTKEIFLCHGLIIAKETCLTQNC